MRYENPIFLAGNCLPFYTSYTTRILAYHKPNCLRLASWFGYRFERGETRGSPAVHVSIRPRPGFAIGYESIRYPFIIPFSTMLTAIFRR